MARLSPSLLSALLLIMVAASGCVLPEAQTTSAADEPEASTEPGSTAAADEPVAPASVAPESAEPAPEPNMTGNVTYDESQVGLCLGPGLAYVYCATRNVVIEGTIDDLPELPVLLDTFAGTIQVTTGDDNLWLLEATMRSGGMSTSQAQSNLDSIQFDWSYLGEGGYALVASASTNTNSFGGRHEASLFLTLPAAVAPGLHASVSAGRILVDSLQGGTVAADVSSGSLYLSDAVLETVNLTTGSGSIYVTNVTADSVMADSGSGSIYADEIVAESTDLHSSAGSVYGTIRGANSTMGSASGSVYASFVPTGSGTLTIDGGASSLDLSVPEGEQFGYDIEAETGSGSVDIHLEDGNATSEQRSATFLTTGFAERDIQTVVRLSTGSGSIVVYSVEE